MITVPNVGLVFASSAAVALAACGADSSGATGPSQSPPSHSRPVGPAEDHGLASVESYYPGTP